MKTLRNLIIVSCVYSVISVSEPKVWQSERYINTILLLTSLIRNCLVSYAFFAVASNKIFLVTSSQKD